MMSKAIRKLYLFAPLFISLAFLAACGGKPEAATKSNANTNAQPAAPIEVSTTTVVERSTRRPIEVVGSLEAQDEVTVSSQSNGLLESISVDVGSVVRRGQTIARLDMRELRLRVEQAEAAVRQAEARLGVRSGGRVDPDKQPDVRQAKAALERARYDLRANQALVETGDISRQQLDVAQRTFEQAEARYEAALENVRNLEAQLEERRAAYQLARKQMEDAAIVSPVNGVVKQKIASRGEYLKVGDNVAVIVQINPLRLRLEVPEALAASVHRGLQVTLRVDAFGDREFQGTVTRINPSVNEQNRSMIAEADVPNGDGPLRPGMFARAQIVPRGETVSLMVPDKSIVSLAGVNKVFVLEGDRAAERQVKIGSRDGSLVEILEGVRAGERVITSNTDKLLDGAIVSASPDTSLGAKANAPPQ